MVCNSAFFQKDKNGWESSGLINVVTPSLTFRFLVRGVLEQESFRELAVAVRLRAVSGQFRDLTSASGSMYMFPV